MKKLLLTASLALIALISSAQEVKWYTDMKAASERAIKENKPMMLFFTGSDWCGWCIRLQNEVFKKPEFVNWINQNVIAVELDFPRAKPQSDELKQQNSQLNNMLQVQGYPTCWFVRPTINAQNQISLNKLGSQGYLAGGPTNWVNSAAAIIAKDQPVQEIKRPTTQAPAQEVKAPVKKAVKKKPGVKK